jgi:hypothetical protein
VRENIVDMVIEMKFSINKYSQVLYTVGLGYRELEKFIIINQYACFPGEGYNFSSTDVGFHTVSNAPALCRDNVIPEVDCSPEI